MIKIKTLAKPIYHVTGWKDIIDLDIDDIFILIPGPQEVEGRGVYFSEDIPRFTAAEGSKNKPSAVVMLYPESDKGWWKTKSSIARKFSRPITWHSNGADVECTIFEISKIKEIPLIRCTGKRIV